MTSVICGIKPDILDLKNPNCLSMIHKQLWNHVLQMITWIPGHYYECMTAVAKLHELKLQQSLLLRLDKY